MYYFFVKKMLFLLPPEKAHRVTLKFLNFAHKVGLTKLVSQIPSNPKTVMGLTFPNPVGIAAGFDKNGDCIDALAALGFGFIEVGTITPQPQHGNPKPRLFRLPAKKALINRLGFNNKGVNYLVARLKQVKYQGVLGVNIGKNRDTPNESAAEDYLHVFRCVARYASYVTINVSSPNTESLRELQQAELLRPLLQALKNEQTLINELHKKYIPIVVKIAPDLDESALAGIAQVLLEEKIDGVIATNTTVSRDLVSGVEHGNEPGGLSGQPLAQRSTQVVKQLHGLLRGEIPIIACGGISNKEVALAKMASGASLIQLYTGLVYEGPGLIHKLNRALNT